MVVVVVGARWGVLELYVAEIRDVSRKAQRAVRCELE